MATPEFNSISTTFTPLSGNRNVDSLINGTQWGDLGPGNGVTITYSVPQAEAVWANEYAIWLDNEPSQFTPLNNTQAENFREALEAWSNVANITFVEIEETAISVGEIRVGYSGILSPTTAAAWTYLPSNYPEAGDIWLDPNFAPNQDLSAGGNGYSTLLHELGHALGLKHSFESIPHLPKKFDTFQYTVMSYTDSPLYATLDYPETPMLYDIAAIQYLYGANMSYHTGDDTYAFSNSVSTIQTLWDADGNDTLSAENQTLTAVIDLREGGFSSIGPDNFGGTATQNVAIAFGASIENAIGGSGNDLIFGNAGNNLLDGGAGADTLYGGLGNDTYYVDNASDVVSEKKGGGIDTIITEVSFTLGKDLENLTLSGTANLNGTGNKSANILLGNVGNNMLSGLAGSDSLFGEGGDDALSGGSGNDTLYGGSDSDTLSGDAGNDFLYGESGDDTLTGGAGNDTLMGGDNNDTLQGNAGNDFLYGDAGEDGLSGGTGNDILYGGDDNDTLLGDAGKDQLYGEDGDDILDGGASNDTLVGGGGIDMLTGGTGADLFVFDTRPDSDNIDVILDFSVKDDTIQLSLGIFDALFGVGVLATDEFVLGPNALDSNDHIIYNSLDGALYYDADGNGELNAIQFASLSPNLSLTHFDFIVT